MLALITCHDRRRQLNLCAGLVHGTHLLVQLVEVQGLTLLARHTLLRPGVLHQWAVVLQQERVRGAQQHRCAEVLGLC